MRIFILAFLGLICLSCCKSFEEITNRQVEKKAEKHEAVLILEVRDEIRNVSNPKENTTILNKGLEESYNVEVNTIKTENLHDKSNVTEHVNVVGKPRLQDKSNVTEYVKVTGKPELKKSNITENINRTEKPHLSDKSNVTENTEATGKPEDPENSNTTENVNITPGFGKDNRAIGKPFKRNFKETVRKIDSSLVSKRKISKRMQNKNLSAKRLRNRSRNERIACVGKKFQHKMKQGDRKIKLDQMKFRRNQKIRQSQRYRQMRRERASMEHNVEQK